MDEYLLLLTLPILMCLGWYFLLEEHILQPYFDLIGVSQVSGNACSIGLCAITFCVSVSMIVLPIYGLHDLSTQDRVMICWLGGITALQVPIGLGMMCFHTRKLKTTLVMFITAAVMLTVMLPVYKVLDDDNSAYQALFAITFFFPASQFCWLILAFVFEELWEGDLNDVPAWLTSCTGSADEKANQLPWAVLFMTLSLPLPMTTVAPMAMCIDGDMSMSIRALIAFGFAAAVILPFGLWSFYSVVVTNKDAFSHALNGDSSALMKLYTPPDPQLYTLVLGLACHMALMISMCVRETEPGAIPMLIIISIITPAYVTLLHLPKRFCGTHRHNLYIPMAILSSLAIVVILPLYFSDVMDVFVPEATDAVLFVLAALPLLCAIAISLWKMDVHVSVWFRDLRGMNDSKDHDCEVFESELPRMISMLSLLLFMPCIILIPITATQGGASTQPLVESSLSVGCSSIMIMVSLIAALLCISISGLQYERLAKVGVHRIRERLRECEPAPVLIGYDIGRRVVDKFMQSSLLAEEDQMKHRNKFEGWWQSRDEEACGDSVTVAKPAGRPGAGYFEVFDQDDYNQTTKHPYLQNVAVERVEDAEADRLRHLRMSISLMADSAHDGQYVVPSCEHADYNCCQHSKCNKNCCKHSKGCIHGWSTREAYTQRQLKATRQIQANFRIHLIRKFLKEKKIEREQSKLQWKVIKNMKKKETDREKRRMDDVQSKLTSIYNGYAVPHGWNHTTLLTYTQLEQFLADTGLDQYFPQISPLAVLAYSSGDFRTLDQLLMLGDDALSVNTDAGAGACGAKEGREGEEEVLLANIDPQELVIAFNTCDIFEFADCPPLPERATESSANFEEELEKMIQYMDSSSPDATNLRKERALIVQPTLKRIYRMVYMSGQRKMEFWRFFTTISEIIYNIRSEELAMKQEEMLIEQQMQERLAAAKKLGGPRAKKDPSWGRMSVAVPESIPATVTPTSPLAFGEDLEAGAEAEEEVIVGSKEYYAQQWASASPEERRRIRVAVAKADVATAREVVAKLIDTLAQVKGTHDEFEQAKVFIAAKRHFEHVRRRKAAASKALQAYIKNPLLSSGEAGWGDQDDVHSLANVKVEEVGTVSVKLRRARENVEKAADNVNKLSLSRRTKPAELDTAKEQLRAAELHEATIASLEIRGSDELRASVSQVFGSAAGTGSGSGSGGTAIPSSPRRGVVNTSWGGLTTSDIVLWGEHEQYSSPIQSIYQTHILHNHMVRLDTDKEPTMVAEIANKFGNVVSFPFGTMFVANGITPGAGVNQALEELNMRDDMRDAEIRRKAAGELDSGYESADSCLKQASSRLVLEQEVCDIVYEELTKVKLQADQGLEAYTVEDFFVNWKYPGNWVQTGTILLDAGAFLTVPLYPGIWYDEDSDAADAVSIFGLEIANSDIYHYTFWICLAAAFCYPPIAHYGLRLLLHRSDKFPHGKLGRDDDGNEAPVFSWMGIFLNVLAVASMSLFFPIIKNLLKIVVCEYPANEPSYHIGLTDMECWTGTHFIYISLAAFGILLYFPPASFLFPHIQFGDPGLDIKYSPSYLVGLNVCKLLIAGITLFVYGNHVVMLGLSVPVMILAITMEWYLQPCLIKWVNRWRMYAYKLVLVAIVCSLLVEISPGTDKDTSRTIYGSILVFVFVAALVRLIYYQCTVREYYLFDPAQAQAVKQSLADLIHCTCCSNDPSDAQEPTALIDAQQPTALSPRLQLTEGSATPRSGLGVGVGMMEDNQFSNAAHDIAHG